jgi:hypothetical protein
MRGSRRVAAALALLIAVGAVVALVLGVGSSSPSSTAHASSSPSGAATVARRDLVETDTESGTLSYARTQTVYNRLSGTITWLPAVGEVIRPGQALFRVAGQPVVLMNGSTPAYRDLGPADSDGQDILELNRDLVALGFDPGGIVVDSAWQVATTDGVDVLQASLGQTETGTLKLGRAVFLPGTQIVSTVSAQLGSQAALRHAEPAPEFVSLRTTTGTTPHTGKAPQGSTPSAKQGHDGQSKPPSVLAALLALLKAETAQLQALRAQLRAAPSNPSHNNSGSPPSNVGSPSSSNTNTPNAGAGNSGGPATAVLTTSSTQLVVTVALNPSKQSEAKVGEPVTVEMPSGDTVNGRVSAVSPVALSASSANNDSGTGNGGGGGTNGTNGSGSSATIPVTITLRGHQSRAGLDQASVSVNFVHAKANNVLSVPVTALLATQGGGYSVQEAASPHHLVPVSPGLFAAGYVQISGPGIYPGLEVTDSQG